MNDTPRTDAVAIRGQSTAFPRASYFVDADFARELERELAAAREDKARLDWLQTDTVRVGDVLAHFQYSVDVNLRTAIDAARKEGK
jgi:hypothetical protein